MPKLTIYSRGRGFISCMTIYRLSSPYLHNAISPFAIDQERGRLERKSVLLQNMLQNSTPFAFFQGGGWVVNFGLFGQQPQRG